MNERRLNFRNNYSGITLIALVISIIVMLILAGVSLNATIGDNGIISKAQDASMKNGIAMLEEFLQGKYIELFEKEAEFGGAKVELLQKYYKEYFYIPSEHGIGALSYIVNEDGKALYILSKSGLPKEISVNLLGGEEEGKTFQDYLELNDVYRSYTRFKSVVFSVILIKI